MNELNKKKIFVAVTNDVSTDQRVHKVCTYLNGKGFDVVVYGRILSHTFEVKTDYTIKRINHYFNHNFLFYAEYNLRLLWYLFFHKFDYIVSNDLDTLPACFIGSKIRKTTLVYDSHEYFTEVPELQDRKLVKNVWLCLEKLILPRVKNAITVSEAIADEYKKKYGVQMSVLRNMPILTREISYKAVSFPTTNKVVLYQGVLNPGRGIKPMIMALKLLKNVDLVIIGYGKVKDELVKFVKEKNLEKRVHFLGRIAHDKLACYTKIADVGMVLEETLGKSFEYSLPNKLFDFIHAGIPIIASPNIEVKKIVDTYGVGLIIENYTPEHIADTINILLNDVELKVKIKLNQVRAKKHLCWEQDVKILDDLFY
tara:strand:+ start:13691 stop:14797 length:1107 start_codon:yes stop_codon:yes gene_type:complete